MLLSPNRCSVFDQAVPGTGPPKLVSANAPNVEVAKYNDSFNLSLRSRSDLNLNPQPEGFVKIAGPKSQVSRQGVYAIETDRGELNPSMIEQVNLKGQRMFQNHLQDEVRPTTKETTLYTYNGSVAPVTQSQSVYSQYIPYYAKINDQHVRINGSSNFGLRSATNYSYFATPGPTSFNASALQNPDVRVDNLWQRPDFNVDGPGTFKGALPDGERFQQYRRITAPTTSGLKLNYNVETDGGSLADYSLLLGKEVSGIENRYTASYQIAPLFTNPLSIVWDPNNKGEIPAFFTNTNPEDYAYMNLKKLPHNEWTSGGYNGIWQPDTSTTSSNAYILGMNEGVYNNQINWQQGRNDRAGTIYEESNKANPGASWGGNYSLKDLFMGDDEALSKAYPFVDRTYTTLGDTNAGNLPQSGKTIGIGGSIVPQAGAIRAQ